MGHDHRLERSPVPGTEILQLSTMQATGDHADLGAGVIDNTLLFDASRP